MASCLTHFSHRHELVKTQTSSQQFTCDLCHTNGSGLRYRCHECNFDLHEHCAKLPQMIPKFFAHPWHDLHLGPAGTGHGHPRICDLCREPVGVFGYRCIPCGFDVHPHCTATKQMEYTGLHPQHSLCLAPGLCACTACHEFHGIWLYRCGMCNVNFHIKCLHGPIKPRMNPHPVIVHGNNGNNSQQVVVHGHGNNGNNGNNIGNSSHLNPDPVVQTAANIITSSLGRLMIHVGTEVAVETAANIISNLF